MDNAVKPQRIRRSRVKGSKLPANTVCVTRGPGMKWGNPYAVSSDPGGLSAAEAVGLYRAHAEDVLRQRPGAFAELRGKNLACWCALDQPCHADVLLELANA